MLALYWRLILVRIQAQLQYKISFGFELVGTALATLIEFLTFAAVFERFGGIGGWGLGEVAFLYGLAESAFATMDMLFSGYDPAFFSELIRRGTFDQLLLRPLSLPLQVFASEFLIRRLGRMAQGLGVLIFGLTLNPILWTPAKAIYLGLVYFSTVAFFGGLFVVGATICFWTVESIEAINILTYGGTGMISYPMHIYGDWMQRFFTFVIPSALLTYYPALYFLDKPELQTTLWFMPFLSPLAGFGVLAIAFGLWSVGVRKYTSTGS